MERSGRECSAEFVRDCSVGLDTREGKPGIRLSGGERQRLTLARALLRMPRILVLGEPTSSRDTLSEQRILQALHDLRSKATVVLASHCFSVRSLILFALLILVP